MLSVLSKTLNFSIYSCIRERTGKFNKKKRLKMILSFLIARWRHESCIRKSVGAQKIAEDAFFTPVLRKKKTGFLRLAIL